MHRYERPGVDTTARYWNRWKRLIDIPDDPCEHYIDNKISDALQKSNNDVTRVVPVGLKTMDAAAMAAAVSAATSVPPCLSSSRKAGRAMFMSSGRPQKLWSRFPSPTYLERNISTRHCLFDRIDTSIR